MSDGGPADGTATSTATAAPAAATVPPLDRASRFSAANMARSILPLVVIVLAVVGWQHVVDSGDVHPVQTVETATTEHLAAARAAYPLQVPTGLPAAYRPTSITTDAGAAGQGDPVTLQIGYVTPTTEYAGFTESDDPRAQALTSVLGGATRQGTVQVAGQTWTRSRTARGETALSRQVGTVTLVVTGSATERQLETVAGSVRPYSAG